MQLPFHGACSWCGDALDPPDEQGVQRQTCHQCYVLSILRQRDRHGEERMERSQSGIVAWAEEQRALGIMRGEDGWKR